MENSGLLDCVVCFRQFDVQENRILPENTRKVFSACSNYLKSDIFTKSWNGLRPAEKDCPFCSDCLASGEKLSLLSQKLEQAQKEIDNFIEYFSAQIQQFRNNDKNSEAAARMKYEIPLENVIVKEENEDCAEDFPTSPFTTPQEELVIEKEEKDEDGGGERRSERRQLRKVIVPLQRLQFDSNGEMILESSYDRRGRAKAREKNYAEDSHSEDNYNTSGDSCDEDQPGERRKKARKGTNERNECTECGAIFIQKQSLSEHMVRKHKKDAAIFECEFCGFQFKVKKELRRHMKRHSRSFSCQLCPAKFDGDEERFLGSNQYDYEIHCLEHREEIPFQCQLCQQIFSNLKNYAHHQKFSCPSSPTPFKCLLCYDKMFKTQYLLHLHQLDHRKDPKPDLEECVLCQKVFNSAKDKFKHQKLENHYLTSHTLEFPLTCDICGMPLRDISLLNNHRRSHKPKSESISEQLDCPHCELKFNRKESLREHVKKKHDLSAETFTCDLCSKEFKVRKDFNQHVKQHSTILHCPIQDCSKTFSRVGNLNHHLKLHSGDFTCNQCERKFPSQNSLQLHVDTVHLNFKRFLCHLCGKGFSTRYKQRTHLKTHSSTKPNLRCDVCGENFMREFSYKEHMRLHTGNPPDSSEFPFICDVCGKLFRTETSVKQHQKLTHTQLKDGEQKQEEQVTCEDCGKTFTRKDGLHEHRKRKHDVNAETFECPVENCSAKFKIRKELHVHVKRHSSCIPCGMCEKTFRCAAQLKEHRRLHTGELFECEKCNKRFISAHRLNIHVSSVHLKKKNFFCEQCGKGFFKKDSYQAHLSTHSEEKAFECKICGEKFNTEHKRKDHRRKMHTGEIFDCHICSKTFLRKATLRLHIKKHTAKAINANPPNVPAATEGWWTSESNK